MQTGADICLSILSSLKLNLRFNFKHVIYPILCVAGLQHDSFSQDDIINKDRYSILLIREDSVITSEQTIIPGSITREVNGRSIDVGYSLIENKIIIHRNTIDPDIDTVLIRYRVLPYPFHLRQSLWDSTQIKIAEGDVFYNPVASQRNTELFQSPGLEYDGALTRGFSLGNNQSLVFNSELNLQLNGNIGDGYQIKAAITDQNLPIQPDGTTRQIQEFDKVYIEIDKDQHSILAGDFDAIHPQGYFMRYNRKLKGAAYSFNGEKAQQPWNLKATAAVSRGKFTRQSIITAEGNQGPYPLKGENGESFIVVLAGSEKVFLDGQLLTRGEDADYIMDYNQSEITFSRRILINVRHRITIEFEYAQFNFQKSLNTVEARYQKNKLESYFHFFQENDSKSVTGDLDLTTEDLALLSAAGDAGNEFQKSGISETIEGYNPNLILYASIDTIVNSIQYSDILVWSTNPQEAKYLVSFSEVGQGSGDYMISTDPSPNGRVYSWVAPDPVTGVRKGNFDPIIPLQAPQQKQMLTTGGSYHWSKNGQITAEFGISRNDLNRYSSLDDDDNIGGAIKVAIEETFRMGKSWTLSPAFSYEGNGSHFRALDPYRNPEFSRDWSVRPDNSEAGEQLPSFGLRLAHGHRISAQYNYDSFIRSNIYKGYRHTGQIKFDTSGWKLEAGLSILEAKDAINKSRFYRPLFHLERVIIKTGDWRIGIHYFQDMNEVRSVQNDDLGLSSFTENKMSVIFKNNPDEDLHFTLGYHIEKPKIPFQNQLTRSEKVNEWNIGGHLHQWKYFKMEYTIKHRTVEPLLTSTGIQSRNLLGRVDMRADVLKKTLKWTAGYEIGNGQEPKTEYKYIKVQKGEGNYIWVDNGNGIEEINEFELAPFADEGEYLKLLAFNNEFIRTRSLGLQQSINIDLKPLNAGGWISKIAALSTYQLNRKVQEDMESPYWNPFYQQYADTAVLNYSSSWRNILYWNRSSPLYDIQLGHVRQQTQLLQTSGFEMRKLQDLSLRWRISLKQKMDIVFNAKRGIRVNESQYFTERDYKLSQFEAGPELNVILKERFRLTGVYKLIQQENTTGNEQLTSHTLTIESVWRRNSNSDIRTQLSLVEINYDSQGNPAIDFALLQGLQKGSNLLWLLQFNTRLNKSLVLTVQYNGRNTGEAKTIHTGSAQVRANF